MGLKGLIWKRLFRALDKVSLLLKINLLIKLVLWSFFWSKKGVANHLGTSGGRGEANGDVPLDGVAFS